MSGRGTCRGGALRLSRHVVGLGVASLLVLLALPSTAIACACGTFSERLFVECDAAGVCAPLLHQSASAAGLDECVMFAVEVPFTREALAFASQEVAASESAGPGVFVIEFYGHRADGRAPSDGGGFSPPPTERPFTTLLRQPTRELRAARREIAREVRWRPGYDAVVVAVVFINLLLLGTPWFVYLRRRRGPGKLIGTRRWGLAFVGAVLVGLLGLAASHGDAVLGLWMLGVPASFFVGSVLGVIARSMTPLGVPPRQF